MAEEDKVSSYLAELDSLSGMTPSPGETQAKSEEAAAANDSPTVRALQDQGFFDQLSAEEEGRRQAQVERNVEESQGYSYTNLRKAAASTFDEINIPRIGVGGNVLNAAKNVLDPPKGGVLDGTWSRMTPDEQKAANAAELDTVNKSFLGWMGGLDFGLGEKAGGSLDVSRAINSVVPDEYGQDAREQRKAEAWKLIEEGKWNEGYGRLLTEFMPSRLINMVAKNATEAQVQREEKRLSLAQAIARGDLAPPTLGYWRNAVENGSQTIANFTSSYMVQTVGIAGGYLNNYSMAPLGMTAEIDPWNNKITKFGRDMQEHVEQLFPGDPARQFEFSKTAVQGLASSIAMGGTGRALSILGAGPAVARTGIGLHGAAAQVPEEFKKVSEALDRGDATERDRLIVFLANAFGGATEAFGLAPTIAGIGKQGGAGATRAALMNPALTAAKRGLSEGGEELGQEVVQNLIQDAAKKYTYSPDQKLGEDLIPAMLTAFGLGGATGAVTSPSVTTAEIQQALAKAQSLGLVKTKGTAATPGGTNRPPVAVPPEEQPGAAPAAPAAPAGDGIANPFGPPVPVPQAPQAAPAAASPAPVAPAAPAATPAAPAPAEAAPAPAQQTPQPSGLPKELVDAIITAAPELAQEYGIEVPEAAAPEAPAQPEVAAPAPGIAPELAPVDLGAEREMVTPDGGMTVRAKPELVELDDLRLASGDLQPRDRDRAESEVGVQERAAGLDPERLMPARVTDTGAPVVAQNGTIISGNGRTMSIARVYRDPALRAQAEAYRKALGPKAAGMRQPVLVSRLTQPMEHGDLVRLADLSNRPGIASMSAMERALRDARAGSQIMGLYKGGSFLKPENRDFFRAFMNQIVAAAERGGMSRDGMLTKEGEDRMGASVLAAAYGDPEILSRMLESTDDNIRGITQAMRDAAGAFIRLKEAIARGEADAKFDITPQISEAARRIGELREQRIKPSDFLAQQDAFNQIDPVVEALMRAFYNDEFTRQLGREKLTELLNAYAEEAAKHTEGGLIPDETSVADVVAYARRRAAERDGGAPDLFQQPGGTGPAGRADERNGQEALGREDDGRGRAVDAQGSNGASPGTEGVDGGRGLELAALRNDFRALLAGNKPLEQIAQELGVDSQAYNDLVLWGLEQGILRQDRDGNIFRSGQSKMLDLETLIPEPATLSVPVDAQVDAAIVALGKPVSEDLRALAVRAKEALGTPAFSSIIPEAQKLAKGDVLKLATIVGAALPPKASKAQAVAALEVKSNQLQRFREDREAYPDLAAVQSAALAALQAGNEVAALGQEQRRDLDALGFYSQALEAAKALKQNKGTPEQMRAMLRTAGVKEAEIAATKLDDFLAGKTAVTKDEIVQHLRENRVTVEENVYETPRQLTDAERDELDDLSQRPASRLAPSELERRKELERIIDAAEFAEGPKWGGLYSIDPSNPTYRETVIHLPDNRNFDRLEEIRERMRNASLQEAAALLGEEGAELQRINSGIFRDLHWDERNPIGHIRSQIILSADGKKYLNADNIQSAWQQAYRDSIRNGVARKLFNAPDFGSLSPDNKEKASKELARMRKAGEPLQGVRDETKIADLKTRLEAAEAEYSRIEKEASDLVSANKRMAANAVAKAQLGYRQVGYGVAGELSSLAEFAPDDGVRALAAPMYEAWKAADSLESRLRAELQTAERIDHVPEHPLIQVTDTNLNFMLKNLLRQAIAADVDGISFTPGHVLASRGEGDGNPAAMAKWMDETVPRALRDLLRTYDKSIPDPVDQAMQSPVDGRKLTYRDEARILRPHQEPAIQFHTFPLTDKVKEEVKNKGMALFALARSSKTTTASQSSAIDKTINEQIADEIREQLENARATERPRDELAEAAEGLLVRDGNQYAGDSRAAAEAGSEGRAETASGNGNTRLPLRTGDRVFQLVASTYLRDAFDAARTVQRAVTQGFITEAWHGTTSQGIVAIDPARFGGDFGFHVAIGSPAAANERLGHPGHNGAWSTDAPLKKLLAKFGLSSSNPDFTQSNSNIMPLRVRYTRAFRGPDVGAWNNPDAWLQAFGKKKGKDTDFGRHGQELAKWIRKWRQDNLPTYKALGSDGDLFFRKDFGVAIGRKLNEMGYDAVVYKNEHEDVGADSLFLWDARQVRSRYDAFDPRASNDPELMASSKYLVRDVKNIANQIALKSGITNLSLYKLAEQKQFTPEAIAKSSETIARIESYLKTMLPSDWVGVVKDRIFAPGSSTYGGRAADVKAITHLRQKLVEIAYEGDEADAKLFARHEVIHVLRESGLITNTEFQTLVARAKKLGLDKEVEALGYAKLYADALDADGFTGGRLAERLQELLNQEMVAKLAEQYEAGSRFGASIDRIFQALLERLQAIAKAFKDGGFKILDDVIERIDTRWIMEAIESGAVAARAEPMAKPDMAPQEAAESVFTPDPVTTESLLQSPIGQVAMEEAELVYGVEGMTPDGNMLFALSPKAKRLKATGTAAQWVNRNEKAVTDWQAVLREGLPAVERIARERFENAITPEGIAESVKVDLADYLKRQVDNPGQNNPAVRRALALYARDPAAATKQIEEHTRNQRIEVLLQWREYLTEGNDIYQADPFFQDHVWQGLVASMDTDGPSIPPPLMHAALADVYDDIMEDPDNRAFGPMYGDHAADHALGASKPENIVSVGADRQWVKVPRTAESSPDFKANVDLIRSLSCKSWCTSGSMARHYIQTGDFWMLTEGGETRMALRFEGENLVEIQGPANNGVMPAMYAPDVKKLAETDGIKLSARARRSLDEALVRAESAKGLTALVEKGDLVGAMRSIGLDAHKVEDGVSIDSAIGQQFESMVQDLPAEISRKVRESVTEITAAEDDYRTFQLGGGATSFPRLRLVRGWVRGGARTSDIHPDLAEITGGLQWENFSGYRESRVDLRQVVPALEKMYGGWVIPAGIVNDGAPQRSARQPHPLASVTVDGVRYQASLDVANRDVIDFGDKINTLPLKYRSAARKLDVRGINRREYGTFGRGGEERVTQRVRNLNNVEITEVDGWSKSYRLHEKSRRLERMLLRIHRRMYTKYFPSYFSSPIRKARAAVRRLLLPQTAEFLKTAVKDNEFSNAEQMLARYAQDNAPSLVLRPRIARLVRRYKATVKAAQRADGENEANLAKARGRIVDSAGLEGKLRDAGAKAFMLQTDGYGNDRIAVIFNDRVIKVTRPDGKPASRDEHKTVVAKLKRPMGEFPNNALKDTGLQLFALAPREEPEEAAEAFGLPGYEGGVISSRTEQGLEIRSYRVGKDGETVASVVVSQMASGNWEASSYAMKPGAEPTLLAQVLDAAAVQLGRPLAATGLLSPNQAAFHMLSNPAALAGLVPVGDGAPGVMASPQVMAMQAAVKAQRNVMQEQAPNTAAPMAQRRTLSIPGLKEKVDAQRSNERAKQRLLGPFAAQPALAEWVGLPNAEFTADIKHIAEKRARKDGMGNALASPEGVRSHIEDVLSNATFAYRYLNEGREETINLVKLDPAGDKVVSIRARAEHGRVYIPTAFVQPRSDTIRRLAASIDKNGADSLKMKKGLASRQGIKGLIAQAPTESRGPSWQEVNRSLRQNQGDIDLAALAPQPPKAPRSLDDIISGLKAALGMPVTPGISSLRVRDQANNRTWFFRPKGTVRALYETPNGVARIKTSSDIEAIAHEGGHHIERILREKLDAVLNAHAPELSAYGGSTLGGLSEAFADWFQAYITNPTAAETAAPNFTKAFKQLLDTERPDILEGIDKVQLVVLSKAYQEHLASTSLQRAIANLATNAPATIVQRIGRQIRYIRDTASEIGYRKAIQQAFLEEIGQEGTISGVASQVYAAVVDEGHPHYRFTQEFLRMADRNKMTDKDGRAISLAVHENPYKLLRSVGDAFKTGLRWMQDGMPHYRHMDAGWQVVLPDGRIVKHAKTQAEAMAAQSAAGPGAQIQLVKGKRSASLHDALSKAMGGGKWNETALDNFNAYLVARRAIEEWKIWEAKQQEMAGHAKVISSGQAQLRVARKALNSLKAKVDRRALAMAGDNALLKEFYGNLEKLREAQAAEAAEPSMIPDETLPARIKEMEAKWDQAAARYVARDAEAQQIKAAIKKAEAPIDMLEADVALSRKKMKELKEKGIQRSPTAESRQEHEKNFAELDAANPAFKEAAEMVYDFLWQSAVHDHQAGRLSQAELDYRATRKHFYVPFARSVPELEAAGIMAAGRGMRGRKPKFAKDKSFTGSNRAIYKPIETIMDQAFHRAAATHFNEAMRAYVDLAERVGPGAGALGERVVQTHLTQATEAAFAALEQRLIAMGYNEHDAKEQVKRIESDFGDTQLLLSSDTTAVGPAKPLNIVFWENGERKYFRINDPEFAQQIHNAVNGVGRELSNLFIDMLAKPATILRMGVTTNPTFILRNIIRDAMTAWLTVGSILDPRTWPVVTQVRGLYHELFQTDMARMYQEVGGLMGGQNVAALPKIKDKVDVLALQESGLQLHLPKLGIGAAIGGTAGFMALGPAGAAFGAMMGIGLHKFEVGKRRGELLPFRTRFFETIAHFSDMSETATRLGVFSQAYKAALAYNPELTPFQAAQEAAYVARDLIDFGRHGSVMLTAARLTPFMNANIQGLDKSLRTLLARSDRGNQVSVPKLVGLMAAGAAGGVVASGAAVGAAAAFAVPAAGILLASQAASARALITPFFKETNDLEMSADDRRALGQSAKAWANLMLLTLGGIALAATYGGGGDGTKDEYLMIREKFKYKAQPVKVPGTDGWVAIPKPFEWALPMNVIEAGIEAQFHNDPRFWEKVRENMVDVLVPPMAPQVARIWSDVRGNFDSLAKRPIVPDYLFSLPPEERYNAYSSEFAIALSRAVNQSATAKSVTEGVGSFVFINKFELTPAIVDYAMRQSFGYWGKDAQKASGLAIRASRGEERRSDKITELPLIGTMVQAFVIDPYRVSDALDGYYEAAGRAGGKFTMAANGYKENIKRYGPDVANAFLARLPEDERAYALLQATAPKSVADTHPMNRLKEVVKATGDIERETLSGRLVNTTSPSRPERIKLAPAKADEVRDLMTKIKTIEIQNTLSALGVKQFAGRGQIDVEPSLKVLEASSPEVAEELRRRYQRARVRDFEGSVESWNDRKKTLLDSWQEAVDQHKAMVKPSGRRAKPTIPFENMPGTFGTQQFADTDEDYGEAVREIGGMGNYKPGKRQSDMVEDRRGEGAYDPLPDAVDAADRMTPEFKGAMVRANKYGTQAAEPMGRYAARQMVQSDRLRNGGKDIEELPRSDDEFLVQLPGKKP